MTTSAPQPLVDSYLKQLRAKARKLPRRRREELVDQIREHLDDAIPPGADQADVRNALEHLGDPEVILAEEFDRLGILPAKAGKLEWAAVALLSIGSLLIPFLGWFLGVILLWASRVWSTREKLIGTLLPPGGLSAIVLLLLLVSGTSTCTGSGGPGRPTIERCTSSGPPAALGIALLVFFVVAGIGTPIFLARRANASRD
jgi:hypothetical protein